ncbi:uncharacterized protein LOC111372739 [Olea europaea var. sylvestris]|uniref:uncharacterized protein LOC111372739 n=1 Tax=Olea europaea var. sylvestris TaxID=158386 RepID=UPI000C1CCCC2|nr:uncharacterized protein LOC111372739 [Olea europaea var. sylvestris]
MHELVQCIAFVYFTTRVPMQFPKFRNSNSGWKSRFFFIRPSKGQFSFNTNWRHPQIRLFNSQVEATPFLEAQIQDLVDVPPLAPDLGSVLTMKNMLKVGMSRPIGMDFDLDEVLRTLPGGDEGLTLVDGAELDLEGVLDSMPDQGQEGEVDPLPIPSKRRRGADLGRKSQTINETSQPLDEPRDVVPAPRPGAPSRARCEREDSLPSFGFPPTRGYHEMGVLKSLMTPARSIAIAGRSADDIERAAAVYLQRVVALQTGLAESNRR